ncbi:hypothetical protein BN59_02750 [Legionella massiliensis]|uniref:Uncharacterized protein n=1 Tax=Legionella massiliensis TaxID=1034943 RepID=A0A078KVK4_9GAMM|nr:vWA domain-containing protein [Legionella massiliensis]CDZ78440.1 hypothetical protein BN59_02750 [Legionella massiliensis]CEE14178.1 hypothetical protein BN1094_02750 [Legionella massiliensis]
MTKYKSKINIDGKEFNLALNIGVEKSTYPLTQSKVLVAPSVEFQSLSGPEDMDLFIVLDVSGSMGAGEGSAKHTAQVIFKPTQLVNINKADIYSKLDRIAQESGGGTSLTKATNIIGSAELPFKGNQDLKNTFVLFITDGQDNNFDAEVALEGLKSRAGGKSYVSIIPFRLHIYRY